MAKITKKAAKQALLAMQAELAAYELDLKTAKNVWPDIINGSTRITAILQMMRVGMRKVNKPVNPPKK